MKKQKIEREEIVLARLEEEEVKQILNLAKYFVQQGSILKKSKRKVKKLIMRKELRIAKEKSKNKVIGFCGCKILDIDNALIFFLVAKKGRPFLAEKLIKSWLNTLKFLEIKSVFLTTRANNRLKDTIFRHCGFKEIPASATPWQISLPLIWRRIFLGRKSIVMKKSL